MPTWAGTAGSRRARSSPAKRRDSARNSAWVQVRSANLSAGRWARAGSVPFERNSAAALGAGIGASPGAGTDRLRSDPPVPDTTVRLLGGPVGFAGSPGLVPDPGGAPAGAPRGLAVATTRADGSGAGRGEDHVGGEAGDQSEQDAPGHQLLVAELAGDAEQLDDDVQDRTGSQGEEPEEERVVPERLPDEGAEEGWPAADEAHDGEEPP